MNFYALISQFRSQKFESGKPKIQAGILFWQKFKFNCFT